MTPIKNLLVLAGAMAMLCSCGEKKTETAPAEAAPAITLPYDVTLSSLEQGNPEHVRMILQGSWKDWEDNNLDNMKSWLADTVLANNSDGTQVRGADSLIMRWKKHRAGLSKSQPIVNAALALHDKTYDQDWVLVWATDISTNAQGVTDTVGVMETWRINKAGKADWLIQYENKRKK